MPVYYVKQAGTLIAAVFVGLSLFALMQFMIRADGTMKQSDSERAYLNFVRVDKTEEVRTKDRQPPREPPPPEKPPETPDLASSTQNLNPDLGMNMPSIGVPVNAGDGPFLGEIQKGGGMAGFDTDVMPVVRVPPTYPRNAKQAGIEGWVTMAVTIRPDGTVSDVSVLEAEPPRLFNQAAIDAMERWKFRPKVVDGAPVAQRARQTIEFKLGGR